MKRIAIDMDEVMADTFQHCLNRYNAEFQREVTPAHFHGKHLFDVIEQVHHGRVAEYFNEEQFFADIPCMPDAQDTVLALTTRYEVFVASAAMDVPCSFSAKFRWLRTNFPYLNSNNFVFCGDKSIVAADYLIDDNVRHLGNFKGEGIIFTAPHNIGETRFRRVDSWNDVRAMFLS